jgi:hypothetical protein
MNTTHLLGIGLLATTLVVASGCAPSEPAASSTATTAANLYEEQHKRAVLNLEMFDDLDFNVFSGQRWGDLHKSHSQDVLVHWPDGHTTKGIDKHIEVHRALGPGLLESVYEACA